MWLRGKSEESPGVTGSLEWNAGWGVGGGSGRGEEACEGQQTLGGPLIQFIWLTRISKNF